MAEKKRLELKSESISAYMQNAEMFGGLANIVAISKFPGNDVCVECGKRDNDWVSQKIGCFLCLSCCRVFKTLEGDFTKLQSIKHESSMWELDQIQFLESMGNLKVKEIYEDRLPSYYLTPREIEDCAIVQKNFIEQKYVHKRFILEKKEDDEIELETKPVTPDPNKEPYFEMPQPMIKLPFEYKTGKKKPKKVFGVHINSYLFLYKSADDFKLIEAIDLENTKIKVSKKIVLGLQAYSLNIYTAENVEHEIGIVDSKDLIPVVHSFRRASAYYKDNKKKISPISTKNMTIEKNLVESASIKGYAKINGNKRFAAIIDKVLYTFKKEKKLSPEVALNLTEAVVEKGEKNFVINLYAAFGNLEMKFEEQSDHNLWMMTLEEKTKKDAEKFCVDFKSQVVYIK